VVTATHDLETGVWRCDWPGTWNMCGAWWGCGCAVVESTWCWLVMTMIRMQVVLVVAEWRKYSDGAKI